MAHLARKKFCNRTSGKASQLNTMQTPTRDPKLDIIAVAFKEAVADAIETHRRMGRSIVVSRDGVVTRVRPSEITPRALPHDAREAREAQLGEQAE